MVPGMRLWPGDQSHPSSGSRDHQIRWDDFHTTDIGGGGPARGTKYFYSKIIVDPRLSIFNLLFDIVHNVCSWDIELLSAVLYDDNDAVIADIWRYVTLQFVVSDTINALGIWSLSDQNPATATTATLVSNRVFYSNCSLVKTFQFH